MKKIIFALLATGLVMPCLNAQNIPQHLNEPVLDSVALKHAEARKANRLKDLNEEKERVEKQEKFKLKQTIAHINTRLEKKEISVEEAQKLKEDAAKEAALNIDNKIAIIENQLQLAERTNSNWTFQYERSSTLELGLGNSYDDNGSFLLGFGYENNSKKVQYDKRTYTDIVVAGGINNAISGDRSLKDSPYKIWKSGFAELGFTFRTRLLKDSNFWRLAYGTALQIHSFELTGNRIFAVDGDQTFYQPFEHNLKYQKLRITNLVFPAYLEFGNSKKLEYYDRVRYSTVNNWKFGIGGYAGLNIWNNQTLRYKVDGRKRDESYRNSFNVSNFIYGVGAYAGFGPTALYVTYDLNPLFKNGLQKENVLSVGLRIDL
ncbi:hypothetical protein [Flavobacterium selenitireducens]|uniref:hypothetical protein n=1 Tax=Flavobacterium selenitireducens TaxID=2722704 RepID=UPI00168B482E|nr:hypothetical protein [Flavobacterium selenitireducens]MBD3582887.1 hypothetical protein [Flavobacterium selenitireducens]